jgi:gamma-glutamylcyclotransferase (GGCT)/AIG2-like uncharacterized protein YtfP
MPACTTSSRVRYIFTYGTLMSFAEGSMGAAERTLLRRQAINLGPTCIRGRMHDAGSCPGVVLGGGPKELVHGEVWQLPDDRVELLAALDTYEGCAPECPQPYPYSRRRIRVRTRQGRRVTAWIYLWTGCIDDLPRIADGRWRGASRSSPALGVGVRILEKAAA